MDELEGLDYSTRVTLNDDDGNEIEFEFLDLIEYEGENYIVLLADGDDEVMILRVDASGDVEEYKSVDDDELLDTIFEIFKSRNLDDFDFMV